MTSEVEYWLICHCLLYSTNIERNFPPYTKLYSQKISLTVFVQIWDGDATSRQLKCSHDVGKAGVNAMVVDGNRLIVARINGGLDFFSMEVTNFDVAPVQYRGETMSLVINLC